MKITTIIENSIGNNKELNSEHGISFYINLENCNILFDTGKTGNFIENAKKLNIDLNKTDYLVLSHAHYDHCGGVRRLLDNFDIHPQFYVSQKFFINSDKYHYSDENQKLDFSSEKSGYKYIGINFDEEYITHKNLNINYVTEDKVKVSDNIYIFSNFERNNSFEVANFNMKVKKEGKYIVDPFDDEIVMAFDTRKGVVILLGCSHPGILNIVDTIAKRMGKNIYAVLGGTHLIEADETRIDKTIEYLNKMNIKFIGVSHCTGEKAISIFKQKCPNFFINSTGTVLDIK